MNYYNIIKNILDVSSKHKLVNETNNGDIYEHLNSGEHKYPLINLTVQTISNTGRDFQTLNATLFYVDRLKDENDNELVIQSTGITVLKQIIAKLEDKNISLAELVETFTPFNEKFADLCAGVYVTFSITFENDIVCVDSEFEAKTITLTKNGLYDIIGFDKALVNIELPNIEESKSVVLDSYDEVTIMPDENYDALKQIVVTPKAPKFQETKEAEITNGNSITVTPDENYDALKQTIVSVEKIKIKDASRLFQNYSPEYGFPNLHLLDTSKCNYFDQMFSYSDPDSDLPFEEYDLTPLNMKNCYGMSFMFTDKNFNIIKVIKLPYIEKFDPIYQDFDFLIDISNYWANNISADKKIYLTKEWEGTQAYEKMRNYLINAYNFKGQIIIMD